MQQLKTPDPGALDIFRLAEMCLEGYVLAQYL